MVKIFKSEKNEFIYVGTVVSSMTEDFEYTREGDFFSINRRNTGIPEVVRLKYDKIEGKDLDGNPLSFSNPDDLEVYLEGIFKEKEVKELFFPKPIFKSISKKDINHNKTVELKVQGSYFTLSTTISVGQLQVTDVNIVDSNTLTFKLTTDNLDKKHDLIITNESGSTTISNLLNVRLEKWVDLRLNKSNLPTGFLTTRNNMNVFRDSRGMYFSGRSPWSSWVKFSGMKWNRGENKKLEIIITRPTTNMMVGIGSMGGSDSSNTQYNQGEVLAYFQNSESFWGLYGNNGNLGQNGSQFQPSILTGGTGIFKIKITKDGSLGSTFSIYELPNETLSSWEDESKLVTTFSIGGTLNPIQQELVPFIIPENNTNQRILAIKTI